MLLIFAASLAIFVYGMVASMLGTINPGLASKFNLDNLQTSYVALAQGIGLVIASVSVGPLLDRKGKKVGLLLGLGAVAAALFILANASGYSTMVFSMLVLGVGGGITLTAANALGSDVSESRRAIVLNLLNVFVGLGGLATPFVAGNLLSGDAVRVAYGAAILTAITFFIQLFTKVPPPAPILGKQEGSAGVFRQPLLYVLAFSVLLYTACEFAIWNWLPKYLIAQGIPETRALNILSLGFALGLLVGRVAVTPILIKVAPLTVTMGSAVLMAITTYAMLQTTDATLAGIIVFCAGLAMAPVFPTTIALVASLFKHGTATAIGFTITCGFSGLVVSSPIIGWLSGTDPKGLGTGLLVLPVCSAVMVCLYLFLRARLAGQQHAIA
uniref:Major facilitator superfamily MFS_1 n=1 Tax=Solibacter usitatus (strain Ellin6076) TaxID=234267 RepID=Q026K3_SOLUE